MLFALFLGLGSCGEPPAPPGADASTGTAEAEALVQGAPLPSRLETVAIADGIALASVKGRLVNGASPAEGARLAQLAADLRARLWRFDQTATDAREATELYAEAARLGAGAEEGCEADRRRALLSGELSGDAAQSYREIYLASRRQAALASKRPAGAPRSSCLAALDLLLAQAVAYRPAGDAMRALERQGDAAADAADHGPAPIASGGAAVPASAEDPPSGAPVAPAAPPAPGENVVVSPTEESASKGPVKLVSIEPFGGQEGARVVLHLSAPTTFQVGTLAADDSAGKDARIFVDIARARFKGIARETPVGGAVRRIRVGEGNGGGARVVLDLAASLHRRIFFLPDPFRIVIDVSTRPPVTDDRPGASGTRPVRRVAIDPGHGGNDSGAVGPTGLREKDVTLDIAHRIAPILSHELKIETLLTRDNDTFVPLDLRTAHANAFHADLFVSIHCNASENGKATGVQTFVLDEAREGSAARLAARENAVREAASTSSELALVLSNLNVGDMAAKSRHVADLLQRSALASLLPRFPDTKDQGIKTAGFFVLVGADMPAVLFETAFISNTDDESRLSTADYRQKLADAVVNAIKAYQAGK